MPWGAPGGRALYRVPGQSRVDVDFVWEEGEGKRKGENTTNRSIEQIVQPVTMSPGGRLK